MKPWTIEYKVGSTWIQFATADTWDEARQHMRDIRYLRDTTSIKATRIRKTP